MIDNFGREINYLRISVTDRCNLRCRYCMPPEGCSHLIPHSEILTFEEILRVAQAAASIGIRKIRLTGGEPLIRHSVVDLIARMNEIDGIDEIDITTNGVLLGSMAEDLKRAGVRRVNVSLDTFDPEKYRLITRGGDIRNVLDGLDAAEKAGLTPIKINCVALRGFNDDEFKKFVELTREKDYRVRFIELMPIGHNDLGGDFGFISNQEILGMFPELESCGPQKFSVADEYRLPDAEGTVGFISALSHHFCATCNKIRLTSDGKIKPCLHSNEEIDVKNVLRNGTDEDVRNLLINSVGHKVAHHMLNEGAAPINRDMNKIGG